MQVSAAIRQGKSLLHYGEFDSFDQADKHLTGEGWECVRTVNNGALFRWEYEREGERLTLKEVGEDERD